MDPETYVRINKADLQQDLLDEIHTQTVEVDGATLYTIKNFSLTIAFEMDDDECFVMEHVIPVIRNLVDGSSTWDHQTVRWYLYDALYVAVGARQALGEAQGA